MSQNLSPEQLAEAVKQANELSKQYDKLTEQEKQRLLVSNAILKNAKEIGVAGADQVEKLEAQIALLNQRDNADQTKIDALNKQITEIKKVTEAYASQKKNIDAAELASREGANKAAARIRKSMSDDRARTNVQLKNYQNLGQVLKKMPQGIEATMEATGAGLAAMAKDPAILASTVFTGVGTNLEGVKSLLDNMAKDFEDAQTGLVGASALPLEQISNTLRTAISPQDFIGLGGSFEKGFKPLEKSNINAADLKATMTSLIGTTDVFTTSFMKNNEASAAFIASNLAGMKKVGVANEKSTSLLQTFVKTLGMAPKKAAKDITKVLTIAKSLGMSASRVASNFEASTGVLSQFGGRMTEVFAGLQAQSRATGVAFSSLQDFAMGFDTFEGAATKAQGLNAVLGGTFLSVTDLVNADPADKITMIQDAIAAAGIDFETADRRMKDVIANAAGFKSVEEASRVLLNKDEAVAAADALETKVMSQEELQSKVGESLTTAQQMTRGLQALGGSMKQFLDVVRPSAVKFGNILVNTYDSVQSSTGDSLTAMMSFRGGMEGLIFGAQRLKKLANETLLSTGLVSPEDLKTMRGTVGAPIAAYGVTQVGQGAYDEVQGTNYSTINQGKTDVNQEGQKGLSVLNSINENTLSVKNLITALKESSDKTIEIQVDALLDGEKVGEGTADAVIQVIDGKTSPLGAL